MIVNRIRDTLRSSAVHLFEIHVIKLICFGHDYVFGQRKLLYLATVILYKVHRFSEFTRGSETGGRLYGAYISSKLLKY